MSFSLGPWLAVAYPENPDPTGVGSGGMLSQSTGVWALRLRSRRALSPQTRQTNIRKHLSNNPRKY